MKLFARKPDFTIPPGGISEVTTVEIGGVPQAVLIQAVNPNNPVLLLIHGGPSMPLPGVSCRGRDYVLATTVRELVKHYVVVFYDQRGTGRSYSPTIPAASMNKAQFVADARDMTDYLRQRFGQEKIYLGGYSWGSVIGLQLAADHPEKYHAYVGFAQIVNWTENDRLSRDWALAEAKRRGNARAVRELAALGPPPWTKDFKQWGVLRNWQMRFNSMVFTGADAKAAGKHPGTIGGVGVMLRSPDYSFMDAFHSLVSGIKLSYTQQMIEDLAAFDFAQSCPSVQVPVWFVHGRKDVHVVGSQVEQYFERLDAPRGKRLVWLERSSHMFHPADARAVEQILVEKVLGA